MVVQLWVEEREGIWGVGMFVRRMLWGLVLWSWWVGVVRVLWWGEKIWNGLCEVVEGGRLWRRVGEYGRSDRGEPGRGRRMF